MDAAALAKRAETMIRRRAEGRGYTRPPYGYASPRPNTPLVPVPAEQAVIDYIRRRRAEEPTVTCSVIARALTAQEAPTRGAKVWTCDMVQKIHIRENIPLTTNRTAQMVVWKPSEAPPPAPPPRRGRPPKDAPAPAPAPLTPAEVQERADVLWDEVAWDPTKSSKDNVVFLLSKHRKQMREEMHKQTPHTETP